MRNQASGAPAVISKEVLLKRYSLAAISAGVGMLALTQPAEGRVVVTKKSITIPSNGIVSLDLNHDGVSDFQFSFVTYLGGCEHYGILWTKPLAGGAIVGGDASAETAYASALAPGAKIGPSAHFATSSKIEFPGRVHIEGQYAWFCSGSNGTPRTYGKWGGDPANRYLGVKFLIHGATHYGWIRLTVNFKDQWARVVTITGYAYETVANKKISAGNSTGAAIQDETNALPAPPRQIFPTPGPSLGMLAHGAEAMPLWRRE